MVDSSTVWLFSWISCLWNSKWTTSISIETLISHLPFSPLELNFKLTQNKYSLQSVINNSHEIQWVTGLNCSCPVLFSHHWGQSCLWFCPYGQKSSACTPLSSHADTAIPVEWQPIRSNVSKHTVISHQHHSKLLWFHFSLEKEVFLYFPTAICSSLLSAAADILTTSFFLFTPSIWEFQSGSFICYFRGMYFASTGLTVMLFWCNWNKMIWPQSFEKFGRAVTEQTKIYHILSDLHLTFISKHIALEILISEISNFFCTLQLNLFRANFPLHALLNTNSQMNFKWQQLLVERKKSW